MKSFLKYWLSLIFEIDGWHGLAKWSTLELRCLRWVGVITWSYSFFYPLSYLFYFFFKVMVDSTGLIPLIHQIHVAPDSCKVIQDLLDHYFWVRNLKLLLSSIHLLGSEWNRWQWQWNIQISVISHDNYLMSLKKDSNKKHILECRNWGCYFSVSHELNEDTRQRRSSSNSFSKNG